MVGSMGCVVPLGLGSPWQRPDLQVLVLDGDGAALMRMGAFATVVPTDRRICCICCWTMARTIPRRSQATVSPRVSFAEVARPAVMPRRSIPMMLVRLAGWLERAARRVRSLRGC
jgi:phosphonopyruvate decarboxylase